jgi:hypothetical protein
MTVGSKAGFYRLLRDGMGNVSIFSSATRKSVDAGVLSTNESGWATARVSVRENDITFSLQKKTFSLPYTDRNARIFFGSAWPDIEAGGNAYVQTNPSDYFYVDPSQVTSRCAPTKD